MDKKTWQKSLDSETCILYWEARFLLPIILLPSLSCVVLRKLFLRFHKARFLPLFFFICRIIIEHNLVLCSQKQADFHK